MIKIKKSSFSKLYHSACDSWKSKFDEKFKKQLLSEELEFEESFLDEMERACNNNQLKIFKSIFKEYQKDDSFSIKTYKEVCKELKIKELTLKDFKQFGKDASKMLSFHKIKNLERLFNGNWKADWNNSSQYKYYPYFTKSSGSGWSVGSVASYCVYWFGGSVGFYLDEKTALHIGNNFKDIYISFIE